MNIDKDFENHWKPMLEKWFVPTRDMPEIIKVHLHEYYFVERQFMKVWQYLQHQTEFKDELSPSFFMGLMMSFNEQESELAWVERLHPFGVNFKDLDDILQGVLIGYDYLKLKALEIYKTRTNNVINDLSWCAEPIIEAIEKASRLKT
jgi:hypothetical protein